ncbi:murein transglycosylase A [Paludibacterium paludis]|uniref:peptidoglycan lytic exotransglycosylase n=1 Tax=Paludibacterium paludis TaxID=1225769 RepID=A0A918U8K0_9NEIS|nr:MltA domain-containing protein [Paludibacterium paludis]GGY07691.1 murein transglycosylase [Paludibacterium paludis]
MLNRVSLLLVLLLAACSTTPPGGPAVSPVSSQGTRVSDLPDWAGQNVSDSLPALLNTCKAVARRPEWSAPCHAASRLNGAGDDAIRRFFEDYFLAWKAGDGRSDTGLVTGYYEPLLNGSLTRSERTPWPVYGAPRDLVTLDVPASLRGKAQLVARRVSASRLAVVPGVSSPRVGEYDVRLADFPGDNRATLKGRLEENHFLPYYSRADLARGKGLDSAPVLAWVEDPVELFFLQVQGAGRIQLDDGRFLRVGFADHNGYPYQSIGRHLADRGDMRLSDASMQGIQAWVKANPSRREALFNVNPRYVFFKLLPDSGEGPVGALGVPLTNGYSIAIDPRYIPLGTPVYLATTWPQTSRPLIRLVHAQDTGNAIKGPARADFFWGFGTEAGMQAGRMKQSGSLWLLLPRGTKPGTSQRN